MKLCRKIVDTMSERRRKLTFSFCRQWTRRDFSLLSAGRRWCLFGEIEGFDGGRRPNKRVYPNRPRQSCSDKPECVCWNSEMWHLPPRRSPGQRRLVAHGQRGRQEPADLSDPGQRAAFHHRAVGTTGSKGSSSSWRWVGSENMNFFWFFSLQTWSISSHEVRRIYWFPVCFKNNFCSGLWHRTAGHMLRRSETNTTQQNYVNYSCTCTSPWSPNDARSSEHPPRLWCHSAQSCFVKLHCSQ